AAAPALLSRERTVDHPDVRVRAREWRRRDGVRAAAGNGRRIVRETAPVGKRNRRSDARNLLHAAREPVREQRGGDERRRDVVSKEAETSLELSPGRAESGNARRAVGAEEPGETRARAHVDGS